MVESDLEKLEYMIPNIATNASGYSYVFGSSSRKVDLAIYELPLADMGNLLHLEWRRWKLEVVMFPWWIVIFSQFQRCSLCFRGCPVE